MNIAGKEIRIFGDTSKAAPIVYLYTFRQEGEKVWKQCGKIAPAGSSSWKLVAWTGTRICRRGPLKTFAEDTACTGGGEEWLQVLTSQIIPAVEKDFTVTRRCIAGYSLAGLFAPWAVYRTDVFDGVISIRVFWYPGFIEFADSHVLMGQLSSIYFSLATVKAMSAIRLCNV